MAGAMVDISMLGDKALDRKLRGMMPAVANKIVRKAMRPAFKPVLAAVKNAAASATNPANDSDIMLRVSRGMKMRALKRKRGQFGIRIVTPPRDKLGIAADSKWYEPAHIELGTEDTPAIPFMRAPFKAQESRVMSRMRKGLWDILRKEAAQ